MTYIELLQDELEFTEERYKQATSSGAKKILKLTITQIKRDILRESEKNQGANS